MRFLTKLPYSVFFGYLIAMLPAIATVSVAAPASEPVEARIGVIRQPQSAHLKSLNGKTIRSIAIEVQEVFDDNDIGSIYRTANALKINTRVKIVRRELLFKEGEHFDSFRVSESERVLRAMRYLRRVDIVCTADGDNVDVRVVVQDTWTLIPQINYSSGTGNSRRSVGLVDSNLVGLGKRAEMLYEEQRNRRTLEAVWEDPRVLQSDYRLLAAYFNRNDGNRSVFSFGEPFRTLLDRESWGVTTDNSDTVGLLYQNGTEDYIYRQKVAEFSSRYTVARGNPETDLRRYSLGYDYLEHRFYQATLDDYSAMDLNPGEVSNDPGRLPSNRRFSGPVFNYEHLTPNYVSMNYIDRFERVSDYDLGGRYSLNFMFAPTILGSNEDTLLFSGSASQNIDLGNESFIRSEVGVATRYSTSGLADSLLRFEGKYYNVLGQKYINGMFVGRHTLATNFFVDDGINLDGDRQFLVGGDNVLRGYATNAFSGDKRYGLNLEDRVHFVDDMFHLISLGGAAFFDAGGATNSSLASLARDHTYSDVGLGLRFAFPRSSGGFGVAR